MTDIKNEFDVGQDFFGLNPFEDPALSEWLSSVEHTMGDMLDEADLPQSGALTDDSQKLAKLEQASLLYGVRLQQAGQVYFFPTLGLEAAVGTKILVEFEQGQFLGEIVSVFSAAEKTVHAAELADGDIVAVATAKDIAVHTENRLLAAEAAAFCKICIRQRELEMKLIDVEVLHDRSKIIFFFSAPSRIDFRELVKDLVRHYRTRIELRQIGVRHEAQMLGGLGSCGMVCCCHRYLRKFAPVTIKMAKEQNLFLNPAKLSGMCGRLLCCLSFEQGNYDHFNKRGPKVGKRYTTTSGRMRVLRTNMFSQTIYCISENNEEREFTLDEWEEISPERMEYSQDAKQVQHSSKRSEEGNALEKQQEKNPVQQGQESSRRSGSQARKKKRS